MKRLSDEELNELITIREFMGDTGKTHAALTELRQLREVLDNVEFYLDRSGLAEQCAAKMVAQIRFRTPTPTEDQIVAVRDALLGRVIGDRAELQAKEGAEK